MRLTVLYVSLSLPSFFLSLQNLLFFSSVTSSLGLTLIYYFILPLLYVHMLQASGLSKHLSILCHSFSLSPSSSPSPSSTTHSSPSLHGHGHHKRSKSSPSSPRRVSTQQQQQQRKATKPPRPPSSGQLHDPTSLEEPSSTTGGGGGGSGSPTAFMRVTRPPNVPGIYEDEEPLSSSDEDGPALGVADDREPKQHKRSPPRKWKTRPRLSVSRLPLPSRLTPSPPPTPPAPALATQPMPTTPFCCWSRARRSCYPEEET
jgi:hypothetical protein